VGNCSGSWRAGLGWDWGTCKYWLARTRGQKLERVIGRTNRTRLASKVVKPNVVLQRRILALRQELRQGDLGFVGAQAMQMRWSLPAPKANCRACEPSGACSNAMALWMPFGGLRRSAPPAGWYLPDVASGDAELDAFDVIEDLSAGSGAKAGRAYDASTLGVGLRGVGQRHLARPLALRAAGSPLAAARLSGVCPVRQRFALQGTHTHPDVLGRSSAVGLSWGSRLSLRQFGNMGRKISMRASTISGSKKSGSVSARQSAPPSSDQRSFVAAYQQRARAPTDQSPTRRAFPKRWQRICNAVPTAPSFTCAARITRRDPGAGTRWRWTHCGAPLGGAPR